jgi:hypothetical protein
MAGGSGTNRARQPHHENSGQQQQQHNMRSHGGPAPYDGPASQTSSQQGDQGDQPRQNPFPPGPGYDPTKPTAAKSSIISNTRVELPVAAYALDAHGVSFTFIQGAHFNGYAFRRADIYF